eukprot:Filipodium_phascolosomae@DN5072_c0_g1_i1.p1
MKACGARVSVTEVDPICALQAAMEGYSVKRLQSVLPIADIVITCTGNKDVVTANDLNKLKNNAIVGNIGRLDNEIDIAGLSRIPGIVKEQIKAHVHRWVFPDGRGLIVLAEGRLLNRACGAAAAHPAFAMSCAFANQTLAQIELWTNRESRKYGVSVHRLSKETDETVARLHLASLDIQLTELSPAQAEYINTTPAGPYKLPQYRY